MKKDYAEQRASILRDLDGLACEVDTDRKVGFPWLERDLFNACAVLAGGEVRAIYPKRFLPNYGVFDEVRYFQPGRQLLLDCE